jgi:hypothetical protein
MSCICLPYNTDQLVAAVKTGLELVQGWIVDYIQRNAPGLQVYLVWLPTALVVMAAMTAFVSGNVGKPDGGLELTRCIFVAIQAEWLHPTSPSTPIFAPVPWVVDMEKRIDDWLKRKFGITEPALGDEWESFVEFEYDTFEEEERIMCLQMQDHENKLSKYAQAQERTESKAKAREFRRHLVAINLMGQLSMTPLYTSIHPVNREALQVVPKHSIPVKEVDDGHVGSATKKYSTKAFRNYHIKEWRRSSVTAVVEKEEGTVQAAAAEAGIKNDQGVLGVQILDKDFQETTNDQTRTDLQSPFAFTMDIPHIPTRPLRPSETQVAAAFDVVKTQGWSQGQTADVRPTRQSSTISEDRTLVNSTRSSSLLPSTVASPGCITPAVHSRDIEVEKVIAQAVHEVALLKSRNEAKPISWNELSSGSPDKSKTRSFFGFKREPKVEKLWEPKTIDVYRKQVHRSIKDTDLEEQHRLVYRAASRRDSQLKAVAEEPTKPVSRFIATRPAPTPVQRPKLQIDTFPLRRVSARDGRASVNDLRKESYHYSAPPVQTYKKLAIASPGRCNEEKRRIVDKSWTRGSVEAVGADFVPSFYGQAVTPVESKDGRKAQSMRGGQEHSSIKIAGTTDEHKISYGSMKSWISSVRSSKTSDTRFTWLGKDDEEDYIPMLSPESVSSPMSGAQWAATSPSGSATPDFIPLDGRIRSYMAIERVNKARRKANDVKRQQRVERIKERAAVISEMLEKRRVERERVRRVKRVTGVALVESLFVKGV